MCKHFQFPKLQIPNSNIKFPEPEGPLEGYYMLKIWNSSGSILSVLFHQHAQLHPCKGNTRQLLKKLPVHILYYDPIIDPPPPPLPVLSCATRSLLAATDPGVQSVHKCSCLSGKTQVYHEYPCLTLVLLIISADHHKPQQLVC